MLHMLAAHTAEIDDIDAAVQEILAQLDLPHALRARSVGLLSCHTEFVESGVVRALCDALPFDVVGATTLGSGMPAASGTLQLTLAVLTGDDVSFGTAVSAPLTTETLDESVAAACKAANAEAAGDDPALVLAYIPSLSQVAGELIWQRLDAATGGAPLFGTLACDHTVGLTNAHTLHNGVASRDRMSLVTVRGNVHPRFFLACISDSSMQRQKGIVTDSDGYLLREVNGMPFAQYLRACGLIDGDSVQALRALPFIVDYVDGTKPVARAILEITEEGHAVCGGFVPKDATLRIGCLDHQEVLRTAERTVREALACEDIHGMLIYSCVVRNYTLGPDVLAELETVQANIGGSVPYLMGYAGGEVCPVYADDGAPINRFHHYTFIACVL